jgi:hypothetical protein
MDFNLAGRTAVVTRGQHRHRTGRRPPAGRQRRPREYAPHSHGQPRQPPVPEPGQRAQINPFSVLLQTRTDYEAWQGASRLRAAEYFLYADGDFAATGDTERPVPAPSRSRSG